MATHAVNLDEKYFRVAEKKARALGTTPEEFVRRLIDADDALDDRSFDQLLAPIRAGFESMTDEQVDALFDDARKRTLDDK